MEGNEMIKRIPKFQSIEEEREFWRTHEIVDYEPSLKRIRVSFPKPKKLISLRLENSQIRMLKAMAVQRGLGYQTLIRMWIQERLQREKKKSA